MRAKAQLGKSHLPINIEERQKKDLTSQLSSWNAAHGTTLDVKDVLEVFRSDECDDSRDL